MKTLTILASAFILCACGGGGGSTGVQQTTNNLPEPQVFREDIQLSKEVKTSEYSFTSSTAKNVNLYCTYSASKTLTGKQYDAYLYIDGANAGFKKGLNFNSDINICDTPIYLDAGKHSAYMLFKSALDESITISVSMLACGPEGSSACSNWYHTDNAQQPTVHKGIDPQAKVFNQYIGPKQ